MGSLILKKRTLIIFCLLAHALLWPPVLQTTAQPKRKPTKSSVSHKLRVSKLLCANAPYKHTQLHHCYMEQMPNGTVGLNVSLTMPMVVNYLGIVVQLFYKYTTYRPFVIDWNMEYCQAARNGHFSPTTAVMMRVIEETLPDFYYPCPHGNRTYATLWMFEPKHVLPTLPSGDYRMDIYFRDSADEELLVVQLFASVRKQGFVG
uniref:MD-2-related lipid-recognition domain-containing protein n=1 Tax=Anopheles quadriannulatus TaxID=34691 RepID=A0A1I8JW24_ANOQN